MKSQWKSSERISDNLKLNVEEFKGFPKKKVFERNMKFWLYF